MERWFALFLLIGSLVALGLAIGQAPRRLGLAYAGADNVNFTQQCLHAVCPYLLEVVGLCYSKKRFLERRTMSA